MIHLAFIQRIYREQWLHLQRLLGTTPSLAVWKGQWPLCWPICCRIPQDILVVDDGTDQNIGEVFLSLDNIYIYNIYIYTLYIYIMYIYINIYLYIILYILYYVYIYNITVIYDNCILLLWFVPSTYTALVIYPALKSHLGHRFEVATHPQSTSVFFERFVQLCVPWLERLGASSWSCGIVCRPNQGCSIASNPRPQTMATHTAHRRDMARFFFRVLLVINLQVLPGCLHSWISSPNP